MVEHERPRIVIREVEENAFRLFIDRSGEAVRVTEHQLRDLVAIAVNTLFPDDPAIDAVVAGAREEQGFLGELDLDRATMRAVARQVELYRGMARSKTNVPGPGPRVRADGEERQVAA